MKWEITIPVLLQEGFQKRIRSVFEQVNSLMRRAIQYQRMEGGDAYDSRENTKENKEKRRESESRNKCCRSMANEK